MPPQDNAIMEAAGARTCSPQHHPTIGSASVLQSAASPERCLCSSPLEVLLNNNSKLADVDPGGPPLCASPAVGKIIALTAPGLVLVDFPENPQSGATQARHICPIFAGDVGREALLLFENNDPAKPIVIGLLEPTGTNAPANSEAQPVTASLDGEQITLTAKHEIVLRCGKASITLTKAGKILIRGAYLLSRSSGVNRIKGGSVQIN